MSSVECEPCVKESFDGFVELSKSDTDSDFEHQMTRLSLKEKRLPTPLFDSPFYGYVVCDLTPKVETWLAREKNFKPMPDRLGWFYWIDNINLYMEVISWDKVLKDAKMRNQIFFHKLGI